MASLKDLGWDEEDAPQPLTPPLILNQIKIKAFFVML